MEAGQREFITANLDQLVENTLCTTPFLALFQAEKHLSPMDEQILKNIGENIGRSRRFYEILVTREAAYSCLLSALEKTLQTGALKILNGEPMHNYSRQKKLRILPDSISTFQGRTDELNKLKELVRQKEQNYENRNDTIELTILVHGTAGIGKTELCLHYIHDFLPNKSENRAALYFDLRNETTLRESIVNISGTVFGHTAAEFEAAIVVKKLIKYVVDAGMKCFFLFDNCNDIELLQKFFPNCPIPRSNGLGFIIFLIITQINCIDPNISCRVHVAKLEDSDAYSFANTFLKKYDFSKSSIKKLVKTLDNHPLAIHNAVSLIDHRNQAGRYYIENYLDEIENSFEVFDCQYEYYGRGYPLSISSIWDNALSIVKNDKEIGAIAQRSLYYVAYVGHPDLVLGAPGFHVSENSLIAVRKLLIDNSLVEYKTADNSIEMSNVLSIILREMAKVEGYEVDILREIMEHIVSSKHVSSEMYYCAWKYACRHKELSGEYCFYPAEINNHRYSPLHMLVERDDRKSVSFLLKHFKLCKWHNCNVVEYWLTSTSYNKFVIRNTQSGILKEFKQAGYELVRHGDNHMTVDFKTTWRMKLYYDIFIGVLLLTYPLLILLLGIFNL